MLRRRTLLALAAALLAAACSSTKFAYDNLDWIVSWQIGKFVSLNEPQKAMLEDGFKGVWQWHRSTQLPLYVKDLRELADLMAQPVTRQQVTDFMQRTTDHARRAFHEAQPELARLMSSMDDRQVKDLLDNMAAKRDKRVREDTRLSVEELQDRSVEKTEKNLNEWIGDLTPAQQERLHAWAQARRYDNEAWHTYELNWFNAFAALLAQRKAPDFAERLGPLLENPDVPLAREIRDVQAHNRNAWAAMMTDLSQTLTPDQRARAQKRLRKLAKDLEDLAAEPAKA